MSTSQQCAAAGLIDAEVYTACPNTGTRLAHLRLEGWAMSVPLCDAHHELFLDEAARLNRLSGKAPTAIAVLQAPTRDSAGVELGRRIAERIEDYMRRHKDDSA